MTSVLSRLQLANPLVIPSNIGGGPNLLIQNVFGAPISVTPANYYIPGTGNPAVSTSDYYHSDGTYWIRCYDLNLFGTPGQTIAASRGRYFWLCSSDHPSANYGWADAQDFRAGYTNDPGVMPSTLTTILRWDNVINAGGGNTTYAVYQAPWLFYNPDDATFPFYMYGEGNNNAGGLAHEEGLARSSDLITWTLYGPTHLNADGSDWSSFQRVVRTGANVYYSFGLSTETGGAGTGYGGYGKWTSTDALTFTQVSDHGTDVVGNSEFIYAGTDPVTIGSQVYALAVEDNYNIPPYGAQTYAQGSKVGGAVRQGMYVSLVPIDSNFNGLTSPAVIRVSNIYMSSGGAFPGPSFLVNVAGYLESGVLHIWATHGEYLLVGAAGVQSTYPYSGDSLTDPYDGTGTHGPLWQQNVDYYAYIVNSTSSLSAAPVGVTASCASGTVTLTWLNAVSGTTYSIKRYTSAANAASNTSPTSLGTTTSNSITDTPTVGSQYWYNVANNSNNALRTVHCYVSAATVNVNNHINRVIDDGGDVTKIDQTWLSSVDSWLTTNNLYSSLLYWTDPAFGVKGTSPITKIYDYGTTRLPRGGDYTPATANVTYSATGMNGNVPGWTNPNATDFGYFGNGRTNNIRRKVQITCVAAYKKPSTAKATLLAMDEFFGMALYHDTGTPGTVSFLLYDDVTNETATISAISATAANIIAGTFDGTTLIAYLNGSSTGGTTQTGLHANTNLALNTPLRGKRTPGYPTPFLGSGSQNSKYTGTTYTFDNNEALFSASDLIVFEVALTPTQISSLNSLIRTRIGI